MDFGEYETDIIGLRMLAGYDRKRAAKLCSVTETTFKRWEQQQRAPGAVMRRSGKWAKRIIRRP